MGLIFAVPGASTDTWGTITNTWGSLVEQHDHTSGKGSLIPAAALNINADISWASHAITAAKTITFVPVTAASMASYSNAFYVDAANSNLWWRNSSGTAVQITAAGQLNLSAVGGILGDYAAVSAAEIFTDATHSFGFFQQLGASVRQYAKIFSGDLSLFEFKVNPTAGVPTNAVTLKSPSALAASYSMTLPVAVPGFVMPITSDVGGNLGYATTYGAAITAPDFKINASATIQVPAAAADPGSNTRVPGAGGGTKAWQFSTGTAVTFAANLSVDSIVTGYSVRLSKSSANTTTLSARLYTIDASGNETAQGGGVTLSANSPGASSFGESMSISLGFGSVTGVYVAVFGASGNDLVFSTQFQYKRA